MIQEMLDKLIARVPAYAIACWDGFLGICFVLIALVQGVPPSRYWLLLSGFGLISFGMFRKNSHYVGMVRTAQYSASYKSTLAYPKVLASVLWLAASWVFFRYAAISFPVTAQWVRLVLHY